MKIELLRKGKFRGQTILDGRRVPSEIEIGEKELQEVIETFDPEKWKPPLVLGHSSSRDDRAPQFGRISKVWREGDSVWGEVENPAPELPDLIQHHYPGFSAGLISENGKLKLEHVAMLGAVPPAIKNLKVEFSDPLKAQIEVEFAEGKIPALGELKVSDKSWDVNEARKRVFEKYGWKGLKEYSLYFDENACATKEDGLPACQDAYKFLIVDIVNGEPVIVKKAVAAALAILNGARGVKVEKEVRDKVIKRLKPIYKNVFNKDLEEELMGSKEEKKIELTEAEYKALLSAKEEAERLKRETEREKKRLELSQFIDGLKKEGKLTPAMQDGLLDFMLTLSEEKERKVIWLAEGTRKELGVLDWFKKFLEKMPRVVELGEMAGGSESEEESIVEEGKKIAKAVGGKKE